MFAVISPFPIGVLILIVVKRWNAFTMYAGKLPLPELFAAIGKTMYQPSRFYEVAH